MSDLIDNGGYRFWKDDFSLQSAYEDCKGVFDGITDDDSFQECDTGLILYHAHEIMYALKKALLTAQPEQRWIPVTDHLPDEDVTVLVTDDAGGMATVCIDSCGRYEDTGERFWYTSQNVTAWMYTVEPYGGKQE